MNREQLCDALRPQWSLTPAQIDAILADRDFFQPYLRDALARRARLREIPESPIDATDSHAIFLLAELGDAEIIPDLLLCLSMSEENLQHLYGDVLTEHLWLPFARLGFNDLDKLWLFATDKAMYDFSRHAVIRGIISMHHYHPDRRTDTVAFIDRLLGRTDCFPVDHLAGILCDCADSGLMELTDRAKEFAAKMLDDGEEPYPMATADDVLRAFENGPKQSFVTERLSSVYHVNKVWQQWAEAREHADDVDEPVGAHMTPALKIGRNDPCPCGSGKKYKKCHGM